MSSSVPSAILVIDDTRLHYNTSRDAAQATQPIGPVADMVKGAMAAPWNYTLAAITSPVSIWYSVTNFRRIAVYGPVIQPSGSGVTAWANYTIDGKYTAANITTTDLTVTAPLFTSAELDPNQQYNLTVDIWASPDAPYLLDYFLAYSPPSDPTLIATSTASSAGTGTETGTPTARPPSSGDSVSDIPHAKIIIGALGGLCALFLAMWLVTLYFWCRRGRGSKRKAMEEESSGPDSEPLFARRPTITNKSATLLATNASRHAASFSEPSALPVSASATTMPTSARPATTSAAPAPAMLDPNRNSRSEEVRLEPPSAARPQVSASSPERDDFADSPPAYTSTLGVRASDSKSRVVR